MINLLPYDTKKQTRAARTNFILFRCIILLGCAIVFLVLVCSTTYLLLLNNKVVNEKLAESRKLMANSSSVIQNQNNSETELNTTTKSILDRQIKYSDVLTGIAVVLPSGTILESLNLNSNSFGVPVNLKINARTADSESKLKENILKSQLFSDYKLVVNPTKQTGSSGYQFTYSVSVIINKGMVQ